MKVIVTADVLFPPTITEIQAFVPMRPRPPTNSSPVGTASGFPSGASLTPAASIAVLAAVLRKSGVASDFNSKNDIWMSPLPEGGTSEGGVV